MSDRIDAAGCGIGGEAAVVLDLTGLKCPLPALRTRKALRALAPGTRLVVSATDPLAGLDIPNAAREEGARIEAQTRLSPDAADAGGGAGTAVWRFVLRSAG